MQTYILTIKFTLICFCSFSLSLRNTSFQYLSFSSSQSSQFLCRCILYFLCSVFCILNFVKKKRELQCMRRNTTQSSWMGWIRLSFVSFSHHQRKHSLFLLWPQTSRGNLFDRLRIKTWSYLRDDQSRSSPNQCWVLCELTRVWNWRLPPPPRAMNANITELMEFPCEIVLKSLRIWGNWNCLKFQRWAEK